MARVAVVTGGTRGIGRAICERLQADGFTVVANYAGNDAAANQLKADTGIAGYKWDVGDHEACLAGCKQVEEEVGAIDVVVNNAGITRDGTLHKMSYDDWHEVMRINLGGCFNMAKACFPGMRERGWGRIVNIGSINGQAGQYGQVNYAAAKSGIHGFTKALAQEGAKFGVTVNAIAPGYIDTDMVAAVPGAGAREDRCQDSDRAARPGAGNRARRGFPLRGKWRIRHRIDHEHQRRPTHVLMRVACQKNSCF